MSTLTIGELAREGQVNLETIRYYEREGLMLPPPRKKSGHRAYSESDVRRLRFIKRAQSLGFTLREVGGLLTIKAQSAQPCADVLHQIDAKAREIKAKIAHLEAIEQTLEQMKASCGANSSDSDCPILKSLDR